MPIDHLIDRQISAQRYALAGRLGLLEEKN